MAKRRKSRPIHLTPEMVEGAYELLRTTLPFRRWKLPHPDELIFRVTAHRDRHAHFRAWTNGEREIVVSVASAEGLEKLLQDVSHEMVHLYIHDMGKHRDGHGPRFQRYAKLICLRHSWDLDEF